MLKIAIIGKGSQSKRIQKILKKLKYKYLLYKPEGNKIIDNKNFNKNVCRHSAKCVPTKRFDLSGDVRLFTGRGWRVAPQGSTSKFKT